jgi:hypothetical protein
MNGSQLSSLDKDTYVQLLPHQFTLISPLNHPFTFGWYGLIYKFADNVKNLWPLVEGGAPTIKTEAKKETDEDLDLFGDDDEEDVAAAKAAA